MKEEQPTAVNHEPVVALPNSAQGSRLPPSMEKPVRILCIVFVLGNIGLFGVSVLLALGSFFLFDSPNASSTLPGQILFWVMFTSPVPLAIMLMAAIRLQERGRYLAVGLVTFVATLYLVFVFILLILPK